jgi:hypothetical protein
MYRKTFTSAKTGHYCFPSHLRHAVNIAGCGITNVVQIHLTRRAAADLSELKPVAVLSADKDGGNVCHIVSYKQILQKMVLNFRTDVPGPGAIWKCFTVKECWRECRVVLDRSLFYPAHHATHAQSARLRFWSWKHCE